MSVKAFEICTALDGRKLLPNNRSQITCLECSGKNLYIGTDDCILIHLSFEEVTNQDGRAQYSFHKQSGKTFSQKRPISQLRGASALNKILMLCDNTIVLLSMLDLQVVSGGGRVKNVISFCLNENPPKSDAFTVQICAISKKRALQIFNIHDDRVTLVKDIPLNDPAMTMGIDGSFVCVATTSEYKMINYETGATQDLFPFDSSLTRPVITRISREEFLLSAPGALGMFATTSGISQRPPLQWNNNIQAVAYSHPYILALNDEFITVHSILDQQQKQSLPFSGGRLLGEFDGKLFVSRDRDFFGLLPIPVEKQIQALLSDQRVPEALELARNAVRLGTSRDNFNKMYERIQQQAGFIRLADQDFEEAAALFNAGRLDVRELLVLYPGMLSADAGFTRALPPLHEIADIVQLSRGQPERMRQYRHFLLNYLQERTTSAHPQEVDTAIVKLQAELSAPGLVSFISQRAQHLSVQQLQPTLEKHGCHHALAVLCEAHGLRSTSLQIWTEIVDGKRTDDTCPGFQFVAEYLAKTPDTKLLWEYSDWVLSRDQDIGVQIFTQRPVQSAEENNSCSLQPDLVLETLSKYPEASLTYLEYLVITNNIQEEKYHTHLALTYLGDILRLTKQLDKSDDKILRARTKLRELLESSILYRTQLLLSKVQATDLHQELAILYGKLGEHDKALRLLVLKLRDFSAAQHYCHVNSATSATHAYSVSNRHNMFHDLLAIYLDPTNTDHEHFIAPAMKLLNENMSQFDPLKVLEVVPEHWSCALVSRFLCHALRSTAHERRTAALERGLSGTLQRRLRLQALQGTRQAVALSEDRRCAICGESFVEAAFARFPNGTVTHLSCFKDPSVCPVTGTRFNSDSITDNGRKIAAKSKTHPVVRPVHQT